MWTRRGGRAADGVSRYYRPTTGWWLVFVSKAGRTMVLRRILVVALAVAPANAFIAPLAQAPRLAPRRQSRRGEDCLLSPRVPPVVATFRYSKSEREVLENVWGYIEVQTPLYSLHLSAFTPPSSLPSRTRSQALPVSHHPRH